MATLIPALGSCVSRMTSGERRLAERLETMLDDDYLLWYDVPVGPLQVHPDFIVLHPRRGLLILEVKDWKLETIAQADRQTWTILADGQPKKVDNPFAQARNHAHHAVDALAKDRQLVDAHGRYEGKLSFPWSFGVALPNITRRQFEQAALSGAIEPHRVICRDEMTESVEAEELQSRLWGMFPYMMRGVLSLPQIDRVRGILFPQIRVPQMGLFDEADGTSVDTADDVVPDLLRVMDLQQEQLARSLGDGHRVIHGVAGSGKTMILGYRAELLAQAATASRPVLVLCYNRALADKLAAMMRARGIDDRVVVHTFHAWCAAQLKSYGQSVARQPGQNAFDASVQSVIDGVERRQIPSGQYQAVLIDEGHDFRPEWLKLVVQMVDPATNSLLLMYDDAQSIYERGRSGTFSFKSVGIQAQGRTSILKINYRNTRQVLQTAAVLAADLLRPADEGEDGVPRLEPIACGRDGREPLVVRLPTVRDEAIRIADLLLQAHRDGTSWSEMAVLARDHAVKDACATELRRRHLPCRVRGQDAWERDAAEGDAIHVMTMHASKGLEFALVALPGVGQMPEAGKDEREEARLFYVAATRATQQLIVTLSGDGAFGERLERRFGLRDAQRLVKAAAPMSD